MAEWINDIPKWEGNVVEPPESKKTQGYIAGDRPPAAWENWYRNAIGKAVTENRAAIATKQAQLIAGSNIEIIGDTISVVGDLGLTEEEVKLVKVNAAKDADTVGGHSVEKDVPQDAKFTDTIVDITGKVDKVPGKGLSTNDYSDIEKQKVEDNRTSINNHVDRDFSASPLHGWRLDDNNKAEYWNGTEWVRIKGDGYPVGNISNFEAKGDDTTVELTWIDPDDLTIRDSLDNLITIAKWKGTKILRKAGSYPANENDGVLVVDNGVRNQYEVNGFVDTGLVNDQDYYYMAFPYTEDDVFTVDVANRVIGTPSEASIFGVKLDTTDSNPETCLTYIEDSVGFTPVSGTTKNLGSWASFIDESLGEYVTVDLATKQELQQIDRNDFTKLKGGGNAVLDGSKGDLMWKVPKLYWNFETVGTDVHIRLSDKKVDADYVCLAHTKGTTERDFIYYGVSLGVEQSNKLRSLGSGVPTGNKTIGDFRTICENNGTDVHMLPHYPWMLYQIILVILGKNLDTQTQWGNNHSSNTQNVNTNISKGFIFGNVSQGSGVNAFINDPWGNQRQWLDGFKYDSGSRIMVGTENFNNNATGYDNIGVYSEQSWGYIKEAQLTNRAGFSPKNTSGGSSSTYYCDQGRSESATPFPNVGGRAGHGAGAGAFAWKGTSASDSTSNLSARIFMYGD